MKKSPRKLEHLINKQEAIKNKISLLSPFKSLKDITTVLGLDIHFKNKNTAVCAGSLFKLPELEKIEELWIEERSKNVFPYITGFLSFREMPFLLNLLKKFAVKPDVILCDGQGIAHPRGAGLASHLGVVTDIPTVGCAKSHLYGKSTEPPPGLKGSYQFLKDTSDSIIGIVLRSKAHTKPLFVSPGHMMNIELAGDIVMAALKKNRIPEPLRHAHLLANKMSKPRGKIK